MTSIPAWLGAIGALIVIASALGTAVAVYRTNLQGTSLKEARNTISDLRGELSDYERREERDKAQIALLKQEIESCQASVKVLEDLVLKRNDDEKIRRDIAGLKSSVDNDVLTKLGHLIGLMEGTATT